MKVESAVNEPDFLQLECRGCGVRHGVKVGPHAPAGPCWGYNGNPEAPTFTPSILVTWGGTPKRCHSYVTDGKIQYLEDCSHELRGQTIELPDL